MLTAIILAGGFGTRLKHIISEVPKPMAPIKGTPFLDFVLSQLVEAKFEKVVLAVGYLSEKVIEYYQGRSYPFELHFSIEEVPLGTGGAIKNVINEYKLSGDVFVLNGDTFLQVDFKEMLHTHLSLSNPITIAVKRMFDFERYGVVEFKDNVVTNFLEKKFCRTGFINGGTYIINTVLLREFTIESFSFESDLLEIGKYSINIFKTDGFFIDIGVEEDYYKAQTLLPSLLDNSFSKEKVLFLDRDGVINVEKNYVHKISDFQLINKNIAGIKYAIDNGYQIIVVTNQAGIAKGIFEIDQYYQITEYLLRLLKNEGIEIKGIYFCPHHPDGILEEYKCICNCRKPKPGMFINAIEEHSISIQNSIMVGDKRSDLIASYDAGIKKNFLIRTGHNIENETDFKIYDDLLECLKEEII